MTAGSVGVARPQPRRQALEFLRAKVGHQKVSSPQVTGSALPLGRRPVAAGSGLGFPWGREAVGATTAWAWPLAVGGGGRIRPRRGMWEAEAQSPRDLVQLYPRA